MAVGRTVGILLVTTSVLSCGRVGYDPLPLPRDAGPGASADRTVPPGDAQGAGDGAPAGDGPSPDGSPPGDGSSAGDAGSDATLADAIAPPLEAGSSEGGVDAGPYPSCSTIAASWVFGFDSDPTQYDGNGDGIPDWTVRGGGAFPASELDGGIWYSAMQTPLDTRPLDDFSKRTLVDVRLLSTAVAPVNRGAVFWINLNENGPLFSALFASAVAQADGGQTLSIFGKADASAEVQVASFGGLPSTFLDVHLDVDPTRWTVGVWIDQVFQGTYAFPPTGAPNPDHFATLLSWTGLSEFDFVSIVECGN